MCVAVPTRIVEIQPGPLPMARLEPGAQPATCCLAYVPEAQVGDYVLVQQGFAVELLDPESAALSLAAFAELGFIPTPPTSAGPPGE
ncbi:MAG: HypC/HybG/HupF family hydrogenase formation chaperone [Bifidobacteriaceae bacterium]|jgi:hydrogenase expression/formation protein HypC|nr:HypC/HybG/HupF family hydrogenase formation chaperone [Bifidobacteriaceae bacterium]